MISLNFIYFLILIHVISNVHSQSSPGDIVGPSACDIFGVQQAACKIPDPPIESFPKNCSSFIYCCVFADNNTVTDTKEEYHSIKGYLDKLIETGTNVIIMYNHEYVKDWCAAIQCNNTAGQAAEMNNLKKFLDQHKGIKGIVIGNLMQQDKQPSACPDYNQNLKSYIDLMKKTFPNLSIGITISAKDITANYQNPELPWLDFNILDPLVDFYRLMFAYMNECSDEFLKSGQYPLTGEGYNTVEKVRNLLEKAGANSSKIHYRFSVYAENKDPNDEYCNSFVSNYCKSLNDTKTTMCADTIQSLYEKGAYAKQYGAGFILDSIDNDDFDCTCQCGQSYPGYNAVLSGYNGLPSPPPCALFDRTQT